MRIQVPANRTVPLPQLIRRFPIGGHEPAVGLPEIFADLPRSGVDEGRRSSAVGFRRQVLPARKGGLRTHPPAQLGVVSTLTIISLSRKLVRFRPFPTP